VDFDVAVLTNIGRDHLDYHGDMAQYAAAKRRLFDMPDLRRAVLNADDDHGRRSLTTLPDGVQAGAFGFGPHVADAAPEYVAIRAVAAHRRGLRLAFATHAGAVNVETALVGRFNAANMAVVLAVLLARGVSLDAAAQALRQVHTVPGR